MKQLLLAVLACVMAFVVCAQPKYATFAGPNKDITVKQDVLRPDQFGYYPAGNIIGQKLFDNTIIGTTWYDSQTVNYGNVMQRIWAYPDGTVGATWQCSGESANPDRGTGYNYFDGNAWGTATMHIGPDPRTGWPSYAPWGPDGEILCQYLYVAGSGPVKFYKRAVKGTGAWIETVLNPPAGCSLVWQSMITSGEENEFIHLLAYTYDAAYQGQDNALLYYRSSDGAETWEISEQIIDGLGPDYFLTISALRYAWANPVGSTIAFTYGFDEYGGRVFKSSDNGDSWEMIEAMETPIDPFNPPTDSQRIPCGIGSSACALDSQGNVHVVFPRMGKIWVAGELRYYPYTDGLIYWNETMPVIDTTLISSFTLDYLEASGNLCGWVMSSDTNVVIPDGQPDYANALCGFPQLSIDAEDNIFVATSTLAPDYDNGEFFYRHILVNSSFDMGNSWEGQIDLNADIQYVFSECAYPAMAPVIGDNVTLLFQEDPYPGMYEWLANHDPVENHMMFMAIDKDAFVGVKEQNPAPSFELAIYPNPASTEIFLSIGLKTEANIKLDLHNAMGQTVLMKNLGNYPQGNHRVTLDISGLPAGMYYCVISAGDREVTRKVLVQ